MPTSGNFLASDHEAERVVARSKMQNTSLSPNGLRAMDNEGASPFQETMMEREAWLWQ